MSPIYGRRLLRKPILAYFLLDLRHNQALRQGLQQVLRLAWQPIDWLHFVQLHSVLAVVLRLGWVEYKLQALDIGLELGGLNK